MRNNKIGAREIASFVDVSPRTIRDWKREKFNITKEAIVRISGPLKSPELKNINDLNRRGGIARYKKYGNFATIEGCRKGGSKTMSILRSRGIIPPCKHFLLPKKQTVELAEFTGILLGDGGITKEQATITFNSEADKQYVEYVNNLGRKLFSDKPTIAKRKNCKAIDIRFSGKRLVEYLVDKGLVVGNKVKHQVGVPNWVLNNPKYKTAYLRGLIDTDGGVFTHRYKVNDKPYVCQTLMELGFNPKLVDKVENKKVWLYNTHEVDRYLSLVKSSNERLSKHTL